MSKIRYGIQLCGKVRTSEDDPMNQLLSLVQKTQNKFARFINGTNLADRVPTREVFKNTNLLSINQINAQIKLTEVWKSLYYVNYPTQWAKKTNQPSTARTRSSEQISLNVTGHSRVKCASFITDAAKLWNSAPIAIKTSSSLHMAKSNIKQYVSQLPV